jgi:hypothetical protein
MNALSIPTWVVHISSVLEWTLAIWYVHNLALLTRSIYWHWFALAMIPALISALCACTWHWFDNLTALEWLVTLQAATTLVGNTTLAIASFYLWRQSNSHQRSQP